MGLALAGAIACGDAAGDLQKRIKALRSGIRAHEAGLTRSQRIGPGRFAEARLALRKAELLSMRANRFYGERGLAKAVGQGEEALASLRRGKTAAERGAGFQERAYVSEIDGAVQPYLLYVPKRYDRAKRWPLLIFLHGYHPDLDPTNWIDYMYSPTLEQVCEREGVILLLPFGRSNTEFMGVGESDVLRVMDFVCGEYSVDPDRVILSGASMGGSGTFSIACHYPDRFAAVVAVTGRVDYYLWMKIRRDALPRFKQVQVDADYALELLPNVRNLPILVFHGEFDREFARQSARLKELAEKIGLNCEVVELKKDGHYIWSPSFDHPSFARVLRGSRRPQTPRTVLFRTFTLKYPGTHWVRIERLGEWGRMAEVRAEVDKGNAVNVKTRNVSVVRIGPGIPGIDVTGKLRVTLNGRRVRPVEVSKGVFRLTAAGAGRGVAGLVKTPRLSGPVREAYDAPFVVVYPSRRDGATGTDRANAVRLAREWHAYVQWVPAMVADAELTEDHIRRCNLVLCGSPETNTVLARIASKLPLRISGGEYHIGPHRFPVAGNGMQCIYPNPLNPRRYVLIVHGTAWGRQLQPNHKLDFLPDFIVYTSETVEDGTWFPTNRFLCAGYFDSDWKLSDRSTWLNTKGAGKPDGHDRHGGAGP